MLRSLNTPGALVVTITAAGILMVTMGARQSLGLFISPINTSTGLGITTISLALAALVNLPIRETPLATADAAA